MSLRPSLRPLRAHPLPDLVTAATLLSVFVAPWTGIKVLGLPPSDLLFVGALGLLVLYVVRGRRKVPIRPWTFAPAVVGFLILGYDFFTNRSALVITLTSGGDDGTGAIFAGQTGAVLFLARTFLATTVIFILIEAEVVRYSTVGARRVIGAFVAGVLVSVLAAIYTDRTGHEFFATVNVDLEVRSVGLAFHPNSFGQSLAIALPAIACGAALWRPSWVRTVAVATSYALVIYGLFLADSRGAIAVGGLLMALCLGVFLVRWGRGRWLIPLGILTAIGAAVVVPGIVSETRLARGGLLGITDDDQLRGELLADGARQFFSNPFLGVGIGKGSGVMVPMLILASGGVVLFLAFTYFVGRALYAQVVHQSPVPRAFGVVGVLAVVLMGLPNNSVNERFDYVLLAAVAALALNSPRLPGKRTQATSSSRRRVGQGDFGGIEGSMSEALPRPFEGTTP